LKQDDGEVNWGYETHPGYFAQDHRDILDSRDQTVEGFLWDAVPTETISFVRGSLGMVLFSGDEVEKKLSSLSGGEAARLVFCRLSVEEPNVLILDEPTNHLDLEAIDALVEGLKKYDGTLLFVSHDRWFVQQLANRILEITPDGLRDFQGTYDEYLERLGDDHLDAEAALQRAKKEKKAAKNAKTGRPEDPARQKKQKSLASRRDQLTAEIDKAESRIHDINELFCDPSYFDRTPRAEVSKIENEQKQLSQKIEGLMAEWEKVESELAEA